MKTRGVKLLNALETAQVEWLVLPVHECRDAAAEAEVVRRYFRVPHDPWSSPPAFVRQVSIRRTTTRVLFRQESGIGL